MEIPILPFALGAIALTFAVAVLGWWIASRIEQRRRAARRVVRTDHGQRPPTTSADRPSSSD